MIKPFPGLILLGAVTLLALNVRVGYAEPSAAPRVTGYEIAWYTVAGGGAQSLVGGTYSVSGTAGQSDAGAENGGTYADRSGFWIEAFGSHLYLPLLRR